MEPAAANVEGQSGEGRCSPSQVTNQRSLSHKENELLQQRPSCSRVCPLQIAPGFQLPCIWLDSGRGLNHPV